MKTLLIRMGGYLGGTLLVLSFALRIYVVYKIGYLPLLWDHYGPDGECIFPGAPYTWILAGLGLVLVIPWLIQNRGQL